MNEEKGQFMRSLFLFFNYYCLTMTSPAADRSEASFQASLFHFMNEADHNPQPILNLASGLPSSLIQFILKSP
jgi:hypothetical protein